MAKLLSKKIISPEIVYDLSVEANHNFYANNILVHNCANKASTQGNNLLKLEANYKIAATGTLTTNNPASAYLPLVWTENDHSILSTFRPLYFKFGGFNNSEVIGYKNLNLLQEEIEACSLRRTLDQVRDNMPIKTVSYELLEMTPEHQKFYDAIKAGVKEEADKIELKTSNLLALTTRLRQAAVCPSILTSQSIESVKISRCFDLVEEILAMGEKVVILSNFLAPVKELADKLSAYKPLVCTGEVADDIVGWNVDQFQTNPDYKIIIGTHGRMGTGLTLNAAMYLIMLDTPFTYAAFSQSADRIYRVNNTRPAYIKVLECANTIDERVHQIVETKKELSDYLVDGVENALSASLNTELLNIIKEL